jgi:putative ABC transport system permease protein
MAVRAALGAGRGQLVRQLLTESVLLSSIAGGVGLLAGAWGVRLMTVLSPPNISRLHEISLDGQVLLFTCLISVGTGVLFGLAPAWHASNLNLSEALNADGRAAIAAGSHRTYGLLVVTEVALAVMLLAGAGLMWQSLLRLQAVDLGFKPRRVASFDVSLPGSVYDLARQRRFFRTAREQLAGLPGVQAVAAISNLPLGGVENLNFFFPEGLPVPEAGHSPLAENRKITPGYFETMGASILQGRDFTDRDGPEGLKVCIINETIARKYWPGSDAVGKRLKLSAPGDQEPWWTIIGVARDLRSYGLQVTPRPQIYTSVDQNSDPDMTFVLRSQAAGTPAALEQSLRNTLKLLDPSLPLANLRTMESLIGDALARPRFGTILLGLFAFTALLLTVIGLYGVLAYATGRRTREIGVRIALGASKASVLALIIRQGMLPALAGLGIGIVGALGLTRVLASQLYEIRPTDPATYLGVMAILVTVALAACYLPARRAAKVDPMVALRSD